MRGPALRIAFPFVVWAASVVVVSCGGVLVGWASRNFSNEGAGAAGLVCGLCAAPFVVTAYVGTLLEALIVSEGGGVVGVGEGFAVFCSSIFLAAT